MIDAADCVGRVGTDNPTCDVTFGAGAEVYADWDAFVAAYPSIRSRSRPVIVAQGADATLIRIDLR